MSGFAIAAWSGSVAGAIWVISHGERAWTSASQRLFGSRAFARALPEPALEHQEFNGSIVAVVLAMAVIGYGGFLAIFLRAPADARLTGIAIEKQAGEARILAAVAAPVIEDRSMVRASEVNRADVVRAVATDVERPAAFTPSARTLTALWQRRDTRSLDRAFSTLRRETLAFRSCGMRMTDADRAVARCEGMANGSTLSRATIWTIDFQRTAGRWHIARISSR